MSQTEAPTDQQDTRAPRRKPESLAKLKKSARKLFVERGYHATRPQDIARDAGLGHGTFYLHFPDKRACFLSFVDDAREELDSYLRERVGDRRDLESTIAITLSGIFDYAQGNPGVLNAAMTDEAVIDAEGAPAPPLLHRWGSDWGKMIAETAQSREVIDGYDYEIVGQAIVGALHQVASEGFRSGRSREKLEKNLTRFIVRALKP